MHFLRFTFQSTYIDFEASLVCINSFFHDIPIDLVSLKIPTSQESNLRLINHKSSVLTAFPGKM